MGFWISMQGMLEVELTSADLSGALVAIAQAGILILRSVPNNDLTMRFSIRRQDWPKLAALSEKRGESLKILRRRGLYWPGKALLRRPVLLMGILIMLLGIFYLPGRVFFVRIEGNQTISARKIMAEAENCGIRFGASRRNVRSEKMKNALLSAIPELQWAGINTKGCVAVISVREKTVSIETEERSIVSSLIAAQDGIIVSCTVEKGNPLCKVGQAVRRGQVLVSGYTDCGLCIRAGRAIGEIYATTKRHLSAVTPMEFIQKGEKIGSEKKYSLIIGKKRINFYKDRGISGTTCDKMSDVYDWTLPGGFTLPVALAVQTVSYRKAETADADPQTVQPMLQLFAQSYLQQQMVAGQILKSTPFFDRDGICYRLTGTYACCEMIGREQIVEELD